MAQSIPRLPADYADQIAVASGKGADGSVSLGTTRDQMSSTVMLPPTGTLGPVVRALWSRRFIAVGSSPMSYQEMEGHDDDCAAEVAGASAGSPPIKRITGFG